MIYSQDQYIKEGQDIEVLKPSDLTKNPERVKRWNQ